MLVGMIAMFWVSFQPVSPQLINTSSYQGVAGPVQPDSSEMERPEFGPRPNTNLQNLILKKNYTAYLSSLTLGKRLI